MKVLVACEFSGIVRDAFIEAGHEAISCDLLPTERPGPHVQGDVRPLLREPWGLVIAHPPCTYLSHVNEWFRNQDRIEGFWHKVNEALDFFLACRNANAPMVAVENPWATRYARDVIGEADQSIEPFHYGDPYRKKTCLWLKGLPPLMATLVYPNPKTWVNIRRGRGLADRPNAGIGPAQSSKDRSRTFPGIALAMAQQWGGYNARADS